MAELDKVVKGLEHCISADVTCEGCPYEGTTCTTTLNADALELLKEQQQLIWEPQKVNEHLEDKLKKVKQQKLIAHEDGTIEQIPKVVRCKDCIHYCYYGLTEDTVSECTIGHCENPDKEWFCADGEIAK